MNPHVKFFVGLLFPVFVMVALVRVAMNDMVVWASIWSYWTLVFTVLGEAGGTVLEVTLKAKPVKKYGEK